MDILENYLRFGSDASGEERKILLEPSLMTKGRLMGDRAFTTVDRDTVLFQHIIAYDWRYCHVDYKKENRFRFLNSLELDCCFLYPSSLIWNPSGSMNILLFLFFCSHRPTVHFFLEIKEVEAPVSISTSSSLPCTLALIDRFPSPEVGRFHFSSSHSPLLSSTPGSSSNHSLLTSSFWWDSWWCLRMQQEEDWNILGYTSKTIDAILTLWILFMAVYSVESTSEFSGSSFSILKWIELALFEDYNIKIPQNPWFIEGIQLFTPIIW